jgi:ligand-binding SRPBCC domain-containing protein
MKIVLKTSVNRDFQTVVRGFNKDLFEYLMPPLGLAVLKRYDGQEHGDMVHIGFRLPLLKDFKVVIRDSGREEKVYWFVDRGLEMPLGLEFWQHEHRVVSLGKNKCVIIDHIEFDSKWRLLNLLNYLLLLLAFLPRMALYRRYYYHRFKNPKMSSNLVLMLISTISLLPWKSGLFG